MKSRSSRFNRFIILNLCTMVLLGVAGLRTVNAQSGKNADVTSLDAAFAVEWIQRFYDSAQSEAISAPAAARVYAYAGATLYEAVVPGLPGYVSLSTQLKGMPAMPVPAADLEWDYPTIASAALATVLPELIKKESVVKSAIQMRSKQADERRKTVSDAVMDRSLTQGVTLGTALLAWIAQDKFAEQNGKEFVINTDDPSFWVPTSPGTKPVGAYWGTLRSFSLETNDVCGVKRNIEFSTDKNSVFYKQAMEVYQTRNDLSKEQKTTADFWVDTPGLTGAPAGHWMSIANQLVDQLDLKLGKAAEMFALVGAALGDAFISCWDMKYKDSLLRPETYIKRYIKKDWQPHIQTPPFPTYPSGHSVASAAAAEVLTGLFGTVYFTDSTHAKRLNIPVREYFSFEQAADEAAISRLYGGIHYRFDIENGLRQGQCVGQKVLKNVRLQK